MSNRKLDLITLQIQGNSLSRISGNGECKKKISLLGSGIIDSNEHPTHFHVELKDQTFKFRAPDISEIKDWLHVLKRW
eukprot:TRINITY_DN4976_c0_g1_i1.p1 TRINITY_DN4976_c0_g1~~TRINITY_DN4976_c0_g1_i1.p1  ORF type:complete len:90 (+),score=11.83 TRINITY_DN4976_c0_g1_i1:39-272(+)